MLLQAVKSRNLWLWGEIVYPASVLNYRDQLLTKRADLEQEKSNLSEKLVNLNKQNKGQSDEALKLQENLKFVQEELNKVEAEIKNFNDITDVRSETYKNTSLYTDPFKITALQSVDVTWDNPIGESYGISSNFLQSWHNKPVVISFKGISYMGAFGGKTVGNLNESNSNMIKQLNANVSSITGNISTFMHKLQEVSNNDWTGADTEGKFDTVVDTDVKKINDLLSYYGEGLFTRNVENKSPYIYLLMENSGSVAGSDSFKDGFVTFVGHIKNFTYSERSDKPFLYDYTVQFVGEPVIEARTSKAEIAAKNDSNSIKLTVVASDSGYSLGYGW